MFTDPITLTVNGVAKTLNRIGTGDLTSTYATADEELTMSISHQVTKNQRVRTTVEVIQRKVVTDPLTSENDYDTILFRHLIDRPLYGWSATEVDYIRAAIAAWETTGNIAKLFGKES
jgi:hypothetical protein